MPSYLADILASHRARAEADRRPLGDLVEQAASAPPPRDFAGALRGDGLSCIAEIKRRSPSKGDLDPGLQPDLVAKDYVDGGAACLSVLTDVDFFGGSAADLASARRASGLPVLRKDFTVQQADVADARLMGADAVLLIVAALDDDELRALRGPGRRSWAWPHSSRCTTRRSSTAPWPPASRLVGVNQRDLRTFARRPRARLRPGGTHPARDRRGRRVGHPGRGRRPAAGRRRATTPSWSARRWCGPRTGWRSSRSWSGTPSGRDDARTSSSRSAASRRRRTRCWPSASAPRPWGSSSPLRRGRSRCTLAGDIAKRLPEHVLTVGVFRDEAPQRVVEAVRIAGPRRGAAARTRDGRGDAVGAGPGAHRHQGLPGR